MWWCSDRSLLDNIDISSISFQLILNEIEPLVGLCIFVMRRFCGVIDSEVMSGFKLELSIYVSTHCLASLSCSTFCTTSL